MDINTPDLSNLRDKFKYYVSNSVRSKECHDDIGFMVYPNVKDTRNGKQVNINEVIEDIRTKSQRLKVSHKKQLSIGYFSVQGFTGFKEDVNVTGHTGLVVIDIDKKDNPDTDFIELKRVLQNNRYTYACFTSPSGGLKLVFITDIRDIDNHNAFYYGITRYVLEHYPVITKIDTSGSNVARACFLPYDPDAYYNPNAFKYCLRPEMIKELKEEIRVLKLHRDSLKVILEVESLSFDKHYDNLLNLLKNRTSMGMEEDENRTSMGIDGEDNRTSMTTDVNENRTSVGLDNENQTSTGIDENQNRTSVGLYDNIFNNYRFNNIQQGVLSTDVPFLELLIWKHIYPYHLDYKTYLDERYFKDNTQKPLSTDNTNGFEELDGLDFCEVVPPEEGIGVGFRHKTIASFSMKFIFNNPMCHPELLVKHLQWVNTKHCLDSQPCRNPKPTDEEVQNIVMHNYQKFISGELDFSSVIRKNDKTKEVSKKYVFHSRKYVDICSSYTHHRAHLCFTNGRLDKNISKYQEAIVELQTGKKITYKNIADKMGITERHLRRIRGDELYQEFFDMQKKVIDGYNASLKKNNKSSN